MEVSTLEASTKELAEQLSTQGYKLTRQRRGVLADPPRWAEIIRWENIVLGVTDATSLPFPDAHLDAVFAFGILHHVQNWPHAVREVHRVLKPGEVFSFEEFFLDVPTAAGQPCPSEAVRHQPPI